MKVIIKENFWGDSQTYLKGQIIENPSKKVLSLLESKEKLNGNQIVEEYVAPKKEKAEKKNEADAEKAEAKKKEEAKKKADAKKKANAKKGKGK